MGDGNKCGELNELAQALSLQCAEHLLDEKWLIAPSLRVGHQWLQTVARGGHAAVNVRVKTVRSIAFELAAPQLATNGLTAATTRASILVIDRALRQCRRDRLKYLDRVVPGTSLAETVLASIEAIRLAGLGVAQLAADRFEVADKGEDLAAILEAYLQLLEQERMVDYAQVLRMAIQNIAESSVCSFADVLVLVPRDLECAVLESALLERVVAYRRVDLPVDKPADAGLPRDPVESDLGTLRWLLRPSGAPRAPSDGSVRVMHAVGEVNEVRDVLRHCLAHGIPLDEVELLHTDSPTYIPLVYETLACINRGSRKSNLLLDGSDTLPDREDDDDVPATFTQGIACRYARPGRALLLWLRWIQGGFDQMHLVRMLNEGVLALPDGADRQTGFARLANLLGGVGIGFGRNRYRPKLDAHIAALESRANSLRVVHEDEVRAPTQRVHLSRDLQDMLLIRKIVGRLLDLTPEPDAPQHQVVASAQRFVETAARSVNKLDRFAAEKLIAELADMAQWLARANEDSSIDLWQWLATLPLTTRVLGSGPRPGRLHVDSVHTGGHSGRRHTFIVGLDDSRWPGARLEDPLLLDAERRKLSGHLSTARDRFEKRLANFVGLLARLRGRVHLSYSCRSVDDNREMFPSPVLLSIYRLLSSKPQAQQSDLVASLPAPASFAPTNPVNCLDMVEWWFWRLTGAHEVKAPRDLLFSRFAHLASGHHSAVQRAGTMFTAYDGYVPMAGMELDPTSKRGPLVSAHMLETIGACPRRFFFRYALEIEPPDDATVNPEQWLDGRTSGALLHSVFEKLIRESAKVGRLPNYDRDRRRLKQVLDEQIAQYIDRYPPPNDSALQRQVNQLHRTAHTFLREEEQYCTTHACVPAFFEVSIGMAPGHHGTPLDTTAPVLVALADGVSIRARGRIDRIDQIGEGSVHTYCIWDYKTGSDRGYERTDPFQQGRKVQPYLYVTMVSHCMRQSVSPDVKVQYFGFFFPGVKTVGRRIEWTPAQLANGRQVVEHLCRVVAGGVFIATDHQDDCAFCDYKSICGDLPTVVRLSQQKLENVKNTVLAPFVALRAIKT